MEKYFKRFSEENYYTKDEIKYRLDKEDKDKLDIIWNKIVDKRREKGYLTTFESQDKISFFYYEREKMKENYLFLEQNSKLNLANSEDEEFRKKVFHESLIDEAMMSSAIEGAFSTRRRTEELVKDRSPKNKDEKMILNNYCALEYINENSDVEITDDIIFELHNIITEGTLEEEDITPRYRNNYVGVNNEQGKTIYEAPNHETVEDLMKKLLDYINVDTKENIFVKASIIQFIFLYIHPFFDGNGRTARALSYMYLIKNGYEFFKFFSISYVINEYKRDYYKSILKCEDKDSDLTYFIDFNINMMAKAVKKTHKKYTIEYSKLAINKYIENYRINLFPEQKKLIEIYFGLEEQQITVEKYMKLFKLEEKEAKRQLEHFVTKKLFFKVPGEESVYILRNFDYFNSGNMLKNIDKEMKKYKKYQEILKKYSKILTEIYK